MSTQPLSRSESNMTTPPLAPYPALRMRRLRQADWTRRLVRESVLTPADLIWSMVVHEGEGVIPVASMPGVSRLSVDECAKAAVEARKLGIPAIAVFPHIDGAKKDAAGTLALDPDGVVARAVKAMKNAAPEVGIMCDVALDPFTDSRLIPGMEATGIVPSPSCTTIDQIRSAGVSTLSRTRRRVQSA